MQPTQSLYSIDLRLPSHLKDLSYDNNKLDPIIKNEIFSVSKESFEQLKTKCKNEKEFEKAFQSLKEITDEDDEHQGNLSTQNKKKNRYSDISPYSYNVVELSTKEYINASYVHFPTQKMFIATQGPIDTTIDDFWQMVYDHNVKMIIMLCGLTENNRPKCADYWGNKKSTIFIVKVIEEKAINDHLKARSFSLTSTKSSSDVRSITQLHFIGWPDHGVPDVNKVSDTFIMMIKQIEELTKKDSAPIVVHCSAGVGRTGTFIAMYTLYREIQDKRSYSIYNLVRKMKEMRLFLVENISQYQFIFYFVLTLLHNLFK